MIRNDTVHDGVLVRSERIDPDAGTYELEVDGGVVESRPLTADELAAVLAPVQYAEREVNLDQAIDVLRQWAADAEATTVTSGNAVATLNVVVDRLGVFFARFADLLENRRL